MDIKIILAAGGSGGHIFPSVALASELEQIGVKKIHFVSSRRRLDKSILRDSKHDCFFLSINPMPRKFNVFRFAVFIAKLVSDLLMSIYLIVRLRPDVVVGFGGYSSGAISMTAKIFCVPVIIHEQNYFPGRANKILSRIVDKIAVSFKDSAQYFSHIPERIVYSGNPLRLDMMKKDRAQAAKRLGCFSDKKTVLIMGGSQGSSFLNETASKAAFWIVQKDADIQFIHLTGKKDYESIRDFYRTNNIKGKVFSFLDRIDDAYALCDLAVTRAGAAAVFELAYYSKAMIMVPYPNPKNNQRTNALYFHNRGAAVYREEKDLTFSGLAKDMWDMLTDDARRDNISRAAFGLSAPMAGKRLARAVIDLVKNKKS
ncbi:MAG: undecaprenyldiphospho-muramoylpentapeptide beta-N-acetylglucosaminyltransferase [Candidatus Omnitrophota bacterium]